MSDVYEEVEECLGGDAADRRLLEGTGHDFVLVRMSGTRSVAPDRVTVTRVRADGAADGAATTGGAGRGGERDGTQSHRKKYLRCVSFSWHWKETHDTRELPKDHHVFSDLPSSHTTAHIVSTPF